MKAARTLAACLAAAAAPAAHAFLGIGDIVFDPNNTLQTLNVLHETEQEFDRLGAMLGVSTQQFDQLVGLATAIGNSGEAAPFAQPLSPAQLEAVLRAIPGLEGATLEALFTAAGQLDAFEGTPPGQWNQSVQVPNALFQSIVAGPAMERIGPSTSSGLAPPSASGGAGSGAYARWYSGRTAEDQLNAGAQASADLSGLMSGDWLQNAQQRRTNLQGLAAGAKDAQAKAAQAQTLADQQHAQSQLSAGTNAILLEAAAQNAGAEEAAVRALDAQNQILQDQDEARRNADELRLDVPP